MSQKMAAITPSGRDGWREKCSRRLDITVPEMMRYLREGHAKVVSVDDRGQWSSRGEGQWGAGTGPLTPTLWPATSSSLVCGQWSALQGCTPQWSLREASTQTTKCAALVQSQSNSKKAREDETMFLASFANNGPTFIQHWPSSCCFLYTSADVGLDTALNPNSVLV